MDGFYITLPSNVSNSTSELENKTSHFITPLVRPLILEPPNAWEIALVECFYPYSWYTINEKSGKVSFGTETHATGWYPESEIPEGYYRTARDLMTTIWKKKPETLQAKYKFTEFDRKVNIILYKTETIRFNRTLARMLGYEKVSLGPVESKSKHSFLGDHPLEMRPFYHMYIYTDLVEPSIVGDTEAPILAVVSLDQDKLWGGMCFKEVLNPQYYTINKTFISNIEVKIMNEYGELIKFEFGKTLLKLHVRRRAPRLPY